MTAKTTLYEIINPSDPYTFEEPDVVTGAVALVVLGEGKYAGRPIDGKADEIPLWLFGGHEEWFKAHGVEDLEAFVDGHSEEVAACLESVLYGDARDRAFVVRTLSLIPEEALRELVKAAWQDRHGSLNDIGGRATQLAAMLRGPKSETAEARP